VRVTSLDLANFRNYAALHFEPPSGVCIFIGHNAQGKSNLLEAISLLATGKSFRAAREADLVRADAPLARVAAKVRTRAGEVQAACIITRVGEGARKRFLRNGRSVPYAQFLGGIAAVTFMPYDLALVSGAPALRRRFLNAALSQSDRSYYRQHASYSQTVMQKNALLKSQGGGDRKLLATYNEQLATVGSQIICARAAFVRRLAREAALVHGRWVGLTPELELAYAPSPALPDEDESPGAVLHALQSALAAVSTAELMRKTSLVGPHRDDMTFALGGQALARFGSQGQQRTAVLAAKAAEYALLAQAAGEPPLFLLDDVLSELDAERRLSFMRSIEDCEQAFVTSTDAPDLPARTQVSVYEIHDGHVAQSSATGARGR
jgi:DNA replication and repair protein RecF